MKKIEDYLQPEKKGWTPHQIRQISDDRYLDSIGLFQKITEGWNRVVGMPYIIYMPEKDRVLMLVYLDYRPCKAVTMISNDHGETWSEPRFVPQKQDEQSLGTNLMYLGGGKVMFCDHSNRWFSDDFGETWRSIPVQKDPSGKEWGGWQWEPGLIDRDPVTGKVTRLAETAFSHNGDEYPRPGYYSQAFIRFSYDEGKTWTPQTAVPQWKGINEVGLFRAANRDIVAYCRMDINQWFRDAHHRRLGMHEPDLLTGFGISISKDDGQTWSNVNPLFDHGRHFGSMVVMPNGDIVMSYMVRVSDGWNADGFPIYNIEALISRDHGATWDMEHRIILDEWTGNLRGACAWYSSPQSTSSVRLPDDSILTAYGRAAHCLPNPDGSNGPPRDIGIVRWNVPGCAKK